MRYEIEIDREATVTEIKKYFKNYKYNLVTSIFRRRTLEIDDETILNSERVI